MYNEYYDIPDSIEELFNNGDSNYSITDPNQSGDNIFGLNLFLDHLNIDEDNMELNEETRVILLYNGKRLTIDCYGLGDFHLHGYEVKIIEE